MPHRSVVARRREGTVGGGSCSGGVVTGWERKGRDGTVRGGTERGGMIQNLGQIRSDIRTVSTWV